ncbi:MAG: transporter [bacterium]
MNKKCIFLTNLLILGFISQSLANPILGELPSVLKSGKYQLKKKLIYTVSEKMWNNDEERQDYAPESQVKEGFEASEFEIRVELYRVMMENLEIGVVLPFLFLKETPYLDAHKNTGHGKGDVELKAKYNFIIDTVDTPAISGLLAIKLPTGKEAKRGSSDLPTSSGGTDLIFIGILSKNLKPFTGYLNMGYTITSKGKDKKGNEINPGNIFLYDLTIDYTLSKRATFVTELIGKFASEDKDSGKKQIPHTKSSLTTLLLGIQYETVKLHHLTLETALAIRLTGKNEKTGIATILGFIYEF